MVSTPIAPENTHYAMRASQQWYSRPDDQRFLTLEDLLASVQNRRTRSHEEVTPFHKLTVKAEFADNPPGWKDDENDFDEKGVIYLDTDAGRADFTNWSFSQLATSIGAPAAYLKKLPADIARVNMRYGLQIRGRERTKGLVVKGQGTEPTELMAFTSDSYGRIWDADAVQKVINLNSAANGDWVVPYATYQERDPLRATTLYASDRDCFVFLVNPSKAVEFDGEQLFRGFYVWNSEVGSKTFGLTMFYYRRVCDNRIIHGGKGVNELRIRHTEYGPSRFDYEAAPELERFVNSSASSFIKTVQEAKRQRLGDNVIEIEKRLDKMGIAKGLVNKSYDKAREEEPLLDPRSVWGFVQGMTALARDIKHTDDRIKLEEKAAEILDLVAV